MELIQIFVAASGAWGCLIAVGHKATGVILMESKYPFTPAPGNNNQEKPPTSRFTDEKISDETDTESKSDSALAPAGLKNPFWN
jgi:hypothetical protein